MMSNPTLDPIPNPKPDPKPIESQTQIQNQTYSDPERPTPVPEKRITPSTAAVLNMAATLPLVFDAELNSIRERLNIMKASHTTIMSGGRRITPGNNVTTDVCRV